MTGTVPPIHLRFFLSSPGDVPEERRAAHALIEALAGKPAFKGKITTEVVAYDDPSAPTPMNAAETPQASIDRYVGRPADCDLTIVILWSRLGTPLPPFIHRADGARYPSGTAWELEDAQQGQKEIWIYRRTDIPQVGITDPNFDAKRAAFKEVEEYCGRFRSADGSLKGGFNVYTGAGEFSQFLAKHLEMFVARRLDDRARPAPLGPKKARAFDLESPPLEADTTQAWNALHLITEKLRLYLIALESLRDAFDYVGELAFDSEDDYKELSESILRYNDAIEDLQTRRQRYVQAVAPYISEPLADEYREVLREIDVDLHGGHVHQLNDIRVRIHQLQRKQVADEEEHLFREQTRRDLHSRIRILNGRLIAIRQRIERLHDRAMKEIG